jgi:hypothetical protein
MGKIGRNEPCPCGSGLKYKKCCLQKESGSGARGAGREVVRVSLNDEVGKIQQAAVEGRPELRALGVFILFATRSGDAWLLEVSEMDAIPLAAGHQKQEVNIVENPQTIEVDWSHTFAIQDNNFVVTAYKDKKVESYSDYPTKEIKTTVKKIKQTFTPTQLNQVHLSAQPLVNDEG